MSPDMLPELRHLDARTAAGILARTALFVQSDGANPAAAPLDQSEEQLRKLIIDRASSAVGNVPGRGDLILDWIDNQLDGAAEPGNNEAALERLSADAALPSDIYSVEFANEFKVAEDFVGFNDRNLVRACVKDPDLQEDFGPEGGDNCPSFISIFGKWHGSKIDRNHFLLVAVCERGNLIYSVKHYWRIYPADVILYPMETLVDGLNKFAQVFGADFQLNDWRGRFLYQKSFPEGTKQVTVNSIIKIGPKEFGIATCVIRQENGFFRAAIGIGVNLTKYKRSVLRHDRGADRAKIYW